MNEPLDPIVAERQAIAAKYARFAYVAPQDRLPREPAVKVGPAVVEPPPAPRPRIIHIPADLRLSCNGGGPGGGMPVPDIDAMSAKAREVIRVFAEVFESSVDGILSAERKQKYTRPRQAAIFFMAKRLGLSLHSVGKIFNRDHTTCLHAVGKATELIAHDLSFRRRYDYAGHSLHQMWAPK